MRVPWRGALLVAALVLGLDAWVRLAPDRAADWDIALGQDGPATPGPCADQVRPIATGARAACLLPGTPAAVLARLAAVAEAAPRTRRLAGSPEAGRITWVSRSLLMGYPDYITAEATPAEDGTRLDLLSRQRYGRGDWGVNAARLKDWLGRM